MNDIPRSALILGLAGLIPFLFGAGTLVLPGLAAFGMEVLGPRFIGPYVQIFYGTIILAFMSGVLWGFATKATGTVATTGYGLSVIPALWAFFTVGGGSANALTNLIAGFIGLLALDYLFWRQGLAPRWWMHLRVLLTAIVVACLAVGVVV
ncbi:DUF3429 domain-containing protein [Dinoroseobacter sp. PD6]|uniref:DUF3429 domain-containing protein n=1 Tax=Dinoroseobacter sp. PD6 TaxID=3028384 RepID=UPI00237BAC38|nr:DUF3429 domain-containing protein [Dinoroseobacter sp. PD6]MDD9717316.1 DUF3429 domain-containing protein [Dinoroseobacter sp. PD6]